MRILLLGCDRLKSFLESQGDSVVNTSDKIDLEYCKPFHYIISHAYRYILSKDIVDHFRGRAINLHISYLPWNRGADPNYWSWVDKTPKGVTIHEIDYGIDTGRIISQIEVNMSLDDTLEMSYNKLQDAMESLFKYKWASIRGSYHKVGDMPNLPLGWNTPVKDL